MSAGKSARLEEVLNCEHLGHGPSPARKNIGQRITYLNFTITQIQANARRPSSPRQRICQNNLITIADAPLLRFARPHQHAFVKEDDAGSEPRIISAIVFPSASSTRTPPESVRRSGGK
jgi:hypothetical protein